MPNKLSQLVYYEKHQSEALLTSEFANPDFYEL